MPKKGNEQRSVKPKVRRLLTKYGWFWWGNPRFGPAGKSGVADICGIKDHVFLAVETKFGEGAPTALQIGFLNSVTMEGGFGFKVDETNIDALETFLKHFQAAVNIVAAKHMPPPEIGGPLLDALKALTDYPKDLQEYAAQKEARRRRILEPDEPDADEDNTDDLDI
jgi:Holliday junction resolvase